MGTIDALPEPRLKPLPADQHTPAMDAQAAAPRSRRRSAPRSNRELAAIALLACLFLFQVAWTFRIELLQSPVGAALRATCARLDCTLPAMSAPKLLQASDILVRSHPDIRGALVATLQIENTANFRQPLPDVVLTLSDRFGTPIARKTFPPQSYRHGELAGRDHIEAGQPMLIELSFTDPDETAISYTFHFFRAERD